MPARLQHLAEVEDGIWDELETCVAARSREHEPHEWRIAVLATIDYEGKADARNVVLREVEADERQLIFYTDARSAKVRQIAASPEGTLIFWSAKLGWQLRMRVRLAVEDSGLAVSSRWARLQTSAGAAEYLAAAAPGSELDAPLADLGSRSHFALVRALAESVDWLELHPEGQRRALFGEGGPKWLQP